MSKKVRSGARASEDTLNYQLSTEIAKNYLQSKFNLVVEGGRKKGVKMPDINIVMYTQSMGKTFFPFMLVLPLDVLQKNEVTDENVSSIFKPDEEDSAVRLNHLFYSLLRSYTYNKDDKNAFRSSEWKRRAGVSGRVTGTLLKYSTPKIENFGGAGKKVVVLIDPIRLFHDMLVDENLPNQKFEIWLEDWKKIDEGSFDFTISRTVKKVKGENKNSIYAQMLRKINGQ